MDSTLKNHESAWDIHIIGAGVVGYAIAANHLAEGLGVTLIEQDAQRLQAQCSRLTQQFDAVAGPMAEALSGGHKISIGCADASPLPSNAQTIVIESIVEQREPKQTLFRAAAEQYSSQAILSSNTSTLPLEQIFDGVVERSRCCGLHFFMPVSERPLIEVVRLPETSDAVLAIAKAYATRLGKASLVVDDRPGFVVNRMLVPYLNESLHLLCSGASAAQLEEAARNVGMPMSPLALMDWIGMSTNFHAGRAFWQAYPKRIEPCALMPAMVKRGFEGRATGVGFFSYTDDSASQNLSLPAEKLVESYTRDSRVWNASEIEERLFLPMLLEAACILNEGTVTDTTSIDTAMSGGLGFTDAGGSLIEHFEGIGAAQTLEIIERLKHVGRRYEALPEFEQSLAAADSVRGALQLLGDAERTD